MGKDIFKDKLSSLIITLEGALGAAREIMEVITLEDTPEVKLKAQKEAREKSELRERGNKRIEDMKKYGKRRS